MRRIRTRAIDNFRKLPISAETGIIFDDEESIDDILPKRATVVELPTPDAEIVKTYESENKPDFKLPSFYLRHQPKLDDEMENELEYDLYSEDMVRANGSMSQVIEAGSGCGGRARAGGLAAARVPMISSSGRPLKCRSPSDCLSHVGIVTLLDRFCCSMCFRSRGDAA